MKIKNKNKLITINKMKKQILALIVGLLSIATFAQKNEIKAVEKALKKNNFKEAKTIIGNLEKNEDAIESKYKAKYYFLKGQAYGKSNVAKAADAYDKLFSYEKEIGKQKYTKEAKPKLAELVQFVSNEAIKQYNEQDYKKAKYNFFLTYKLSPTDTTFLYNAAISASLDKDYDTAIKYYEKLRTSGYTGISTEYYAVNKESGKEENLSTKTNRDAMVKFGKYTNPTQKTSPSKQGDIIKNIGYIYVNQGKPKLAIAALKEARKSNPKDMNLLLNEAQMYVKLDKMDEFGKLMEEAITLDPNNPTLFFNLGVINQGQKKTKEAKEYYLKAVELKPDYADAYMNLAVAVLDGEKAIVDEMNKNFSNEKKYNELQQKQRALYKEALPYLEKADNLKRSIDTVRTLMNIYDTLEMTEQADKLRVIYKELRDKQ